VSVGVGGQVGEDCRACQARGKLNGEVAGHADFRARIVARKLARMSVSLSLSVPWNLSFITEQSTVIVASRGETVVCAYMSCLRDHGQYH